MWVVEIYSQGDLSHDEYLQIETLEKGEDGKMQVVVKPKFKDANSVLSSIKFIDQCIDRLYAEKRWLEQNGVDLVGQTDYGYVVENPPDIPIHGV